MFVSTNALLTSINMIIMTIMIIIYNYDIIYPHIPYDSLHQAHLLYDDVFSATLGLCPAVAGITALGERGAHKTTAAYFKYGMVLEKLKETEKKVTTPANPINTINEILRKPTAAA